VKTFYFEDFNIWACYVSFKLKNRNLSEILEYVSKNKSKVDILQVVDADKICGQLHLFSAIYRTYRAKKESKNIAKENSIELLLRLSGKRQINEAISMLGLNEKTRNVLVCCCDEDLDKAKLVTEELVRYFSELENDDFINIYDKVKEEEIKKTFNVKTNNIQKEVLMKISYIELLS